MTALLIIAKKKKNRSNSDVHTLMNGQIRWGSSHIMEYYRAIKGNEVLTQSTTCMNLNTYAKRPDTKAYTLFDFISMRC